MDGPITCEQLRNICKIYDDNEVNKHIENEVTRIKKEVIRCAYAQSVVSSVDILSGTSYSMKNMYKAEVLFKQFRPNLGITYAVTTQRVVDGLKEVFPDMRIVTDPLNTYILLDWS
jgi:hypothetical protein